MPSRLRVVGSPRGFIKFLLQMPNWFFDHHLGRLFGKRFVQLQHTGRKSGRTYHTVVEVVKTDLPKNRIYICSGFGRESDWYLNVKKQPDICINFQGKEYDAHISELPLDQGRQVLVDYAHRYPLAARELSGVMGYKTDGTPQDFGKLAGDLPVLKIEFK